MYLQSKQRQKGSLCFRITNHKLHNNCARKIKLRPLSHGVFCGLESTKEKNITSASLILEYVRGAPLPSCVGVLSLLFDLV